MRTEHELLDEHAELGIQHPGFGDRVLSPTRKARTPEAGDDASGGRIGSPVGMQACASRARTVDPTGVDIDEAAGRNGVSDRRAVEGAAGAEEQLRRLAGYQRVSYAGEGMHRRDETDQRAPAGAPSVDCEMEEADLRVRAKYAPHERLLLVPDAPTIGVRGLQDWEVAVGEPRRGQPCKARAVPLTAAGPDGDRQAAAADAARNDLAAVGDVESADRLVQAKRERKRQVVDA